MTDLDARLHALVRPGEPAPIADLEARVARRREIRRRTSSALGAFVLIAGGVAAWQIVDEEPTVTQVVTTGPTSPPTTVDVDAPIRMPIIDHEWCDRTTPSFSGSENSHGFGTEPRIYAESVAPLAVQIIGAADDLPDRYTVVLRLPNDGFQTRSWGASVEPTGVGHARTVLDDGSALYFRSRGVDQADLEALVSDVVPRPLSAPIPGVDLTELDASQILAEEDGLSWPDGWTASCQHDGGGSGGPAEVHVSVWDGPSASVLAFALDAPPPILMRLQSDDTLLRLWGAPLRFPDQSGADITFDDVVESDAVEED